jgi:hypothetical protein
MFAIAETAGAVTFAVKVHPRAKKTPSPANSATL